tara:strand:+ start:496 stop:651 length:156 start_codon:yes stop_codon:yes gene_type:complete
VTGLCGEQHPSILVGGAAFFGLLIRYFKNLKYWIVLNVWKKYIVGENHVQR